MALDPSPTNKCSSPQHFHYSLAPSPSDHHPIASVTLNASVSRLRKAGTATTHKPVIDIRSLTLAPGHYSKGQRSKKDQRSACLPAMGIR
ncbi:uncharacterized protein RAG0_03888 [Rhynchosporium agropyri]|uniref:Uncharacterized protein n=1 Tax=Rhynchosporium agropyri TaxID=914238 RepID=A0A1E1KAP7_9HELO|nr:uncharacterized protein RAG0_03888 [Rhynchosporium agropyri]